ncbi:MAG TPA: DUF5666 domain-containing protein [Candidatus Woesebacteria bacterium]|jgi:hypothetical protein|nr:DUF5666 domain-containing protein [Candidatus Woesebacteria bacterium]
MKNKLNLIFFILLVVVGIGAFLGGTKYQQQKSPQVANNRSFAGRPIGGPNDQNGNQRTGGQMQNFRQNVGEILSVDDKSITIKLNDGSSKIVLLSETTTIDKMSEATKSDLKTGEKVVVMGDSNSDGSVTARSIELNPRMLNSTPAPTK